MNYFKLLLAGCLAGVQGDIQTCSECVAAKGMTWMVAQTSGVIFTLCVPTWNCKESADPGNLVMCYSMNCNKMPDNKREWTVVDTTPETRCDIRIKDPEECLMSADNMCAWVETKDHGSFCTFRTFAQQQNLKKIVCPRIVPKKVNKAEEPVELDVVTAEEPVELEKEYKKCSECVAAKGMTWAVDIRGKKYSTSCVPSKECNEHTTKERTTVCYSVNCDSLKATKEIRDWWSVHDSDSFDQCSSDKSFSDCISDNECSAIADKDHKGKSYCTFKQFTPYFSNTDLCYTVYE